MRFKPWIIAGAAIVATAGAQPHYLDGRAWTPTDGVDDRSRVEVARSACHDTVTLGLLEEENYDSPLFRMTPSEKRLHALRWAREAFEACMRERGFEPADAAGAAAG